MISRIHIFLFVIFSIFPISRVVSSNELSPTIVDAKPAPADEVVGERPYEMVWADRKPLRTPLINFDSLEGWTLECAHGAVGDLFVSRKQRVWESPVARLVYRGVSKESALVLRAPEPIAIPLPASAVTVWMYGNNWSWVPDPTTPQVDVSLLVQDGKGKETDLPITRVRWKEWWLVHKVLPEELRTSESLFLVGIRVTGAANQEDRELYFEDLVFFQESLEPISFESRPKRGIDPFPGQSPGANTGPGRLPFPTREKTILPDNLTADYKNELVKTDKGFCFRYTGSDTVLEYERQAGDSFNNPVMVKRNGEFIAKTLAGAGPVFERELENIQPVKREIREGSVLHELWRGTLGEKSVDIEIDFRIWGKSLVVDYICRGGSAQELSYGWIEEVEKPELILLPYLNYNGHHLNVLLSRGEQPFFASVWMDWYRTNASKPYAVDEIADNRIRLNGGTQYLPKTDGKRNDLFERVFITFSPMFEETLFTIANPPAKQGMEAGRRLWQESWGPSDYQREHERSKKLRAYGIEMLTQCNHEITWRDSGESFTYRTQAAPKRGGDEALKQYVAAQKSLGWRSGLYTNYCDFTPTNAHWNVDMVMRNSNSDLVTAWPRCYSAKALYAVEMDRKLAPVIQKKFNSNAAYTDVHTSVSPWDRNDYDARVPGAGAMASTFYAYGELLLHDQDVYDGHCWSEGNHQWLYAGLCTGNYGLTYSSLKLWEYPYLPHFDLLIMHPLSVDMGVPWTGQFFRGKEGWNDKSRIEASIDQFIAATIAYGHIGWLVEETHGIRQTCRSYYMLQQLQSRYVMRKPVEILYGTESGLVSSSEAFLTGAWKESRLFIRYPNDLQIWVNGNADQPWDITYEGKTYRLGPYGWLAVKPDEFFEASLLVDDKRWDFVSAAEYVFLDGRGQYRETDGVGSAGSLAVRPAEDGNGLSIIAVEGIDQITLQSVEKTYEEGDVRGAIERTAKAATLTAEAFDVEGHSLGSPKMEKKESGWYVFPINGAIRYEIRIKE